MSSVVRNLIANKKIIVCLGAGGVGKTTSATAIAVAAALSGKRTALLSIDPAKRLAAALNVSLGYQLSEVTLPGIADGMLYATMIDQKTIFDEMVSKFTSDGKARERILKHPLYKAASANFGGAIEYMALAKLQSIIDEKRYDLIVLDTPPDAHALDFLMKPNILAGFIESRVMTWVIKPFHLAQKLGMGKVFAFGERFASGLAEVAGIKALQTLAEFLVLMQQTIEGFNEAGDLLDKNLRAPTTAYAIVSTPRSAPVRSAGVIAEQLKAMQRNVDVLLLNRVMPTDVEVSALSYGNQALGYAEGCMCALKATAQESKVLIAGLLDRLKQIFDKSPATHYVFDQTFDIHSSEGVMTLAHALLAEQFVRNT